MWFFPIFGWVFNLWLGFKSSVAERLGGEKQKNKDQAEVLKTVEESNEINASNARLTDDELHHITGNFERSDK